MRDACSRPSMSMSSGAYPDAPADESESRIRNLITVQEGQLGQIHNAISALDSRLDTVLIPDVLVDPKVSAPSSDTPVKVPLSPLLERLVVINRGFEDAIARLRYLRGRVDL